MANYMKDIAKIFGVELNEKFKIDCGRKDTIAMLTDYGLVINCEPNAVCITSDQVLGWLLTGKATIKPLPWKPNYEQRYYSIGPGGVLEPGRWLNDFIDVAMYKLGNCYHTAQEAESNRDKWIAFYNSDKQLEV